MSDLANRRYRRARDLFRAQCAQRDERCWLCGQRIDYGLPFSDVEAFELDHLFPRSTHPELTFDPGNFRASHVRCNRARGDRMPSGGLGSLSEDWSA